MLKQDIKKQIYQSFKKTAQKNKWTLPCFEEFPLETSLDEQFGDYSTTIAFSVAKEIKKSPVEIAEILIKEIKRHLPKQITRVELAKNGFINFYLDKKFIQKELQKISQNKSSFGFSKIGKKKNIIIDYSSPNIAKPMHIGHLRSTIIGEALANLYECLGYKVIRWNYLGDWGTQFGRLIAAYKLWGNKKEVEKQPIDALLKLYRKFHEEMKNNPELEKFGQQEFKKLEEGNKENRNLWRWFREESLKEFQKIYDLLGIKFDLFIGESFFEKDLASLIRSLEEKKIAQKSEGALIIPLEKYNLPPALIQKSDEASLYLTRDLALIQYRFKKYNPAKILYVVGNEQDIHFKQVFTLAKILFPKQKTELVHIKFGLVLSDQKKKFSTREGELISLEEVIDQAIRKSLAVIKDKNPHWSLAKQKKLAQAIAISALKFNNLKSFRTLDIIFDWEKILDFSGDTSVYLQYTYARINKILAKAKKIKNKNSKINYKELTHPLEIQLIKKLSEFPEIIKFSALKYAPNYLATFLLSLADLTNKYYELVPILKDKSLNLNRTKAQLVLLECITEAMQKGFKILGIQPLKEI
ncbi:MAG: arginine--tRNA ligase [Candidatus Pacebacteria bacterium]|nr:arginine--tRNA ligase [Candidatus Paceibacterota bacterium]